MTTDGGGCVTRCSAAALSSAAPAVPGSSRLEELMERLKVAEAEREQLTRHNTLLERAIVARDRVAAEFSDAKTAGGGGYGLEMPKVPCRARPASLMQSFLALIRPAQACRLLHVLSCRIACAHADAVLSMLRLLVDVAGLLNMLA